jgi:C1A family cysteine protease
MRIATATLTIGCVSARFTVDPSLPVEALFSDWKTHFSRAFSSAEEHATRLQIFAETVRSVSVHNALFDAGKSTYRQGVNQFAVYTNAEYRRLLGFKSAGKHGQSPETFMHSEVEVAVTDEEVDWRKLGAVSRIKDQGQCGSCWTFSATGAMEGAAAISSGHRWADYHRTDHNGTGLSESQIVDCDHLDQDAGCNGGDMSSAFNFTVLNGGSLAEEGYPYKPSTLACKASKASTKPGDVVVTIGGWVDVPSNDSKAMLQAVKTQPVSVAVDAGCDAFMKYEDGVFSGGQGCGTSLDHGVLLAGYQTTVDRKGKAEGFWFLKNSWGESRRVAGGAAESPRAAVRRGAC